MPRKKKPESEPSHRISWPNPTIGPVWADNHYTLNPDIISDLLAAHHWTNRDLGEYMGVNAVTISRWRNGVNAPDVTNASELVRLVEKTNEILRKHNGSIPPEHRWLSPSRLEMRARGYEIMGTKPPESEAKPYNTTYRWQRMQGQQQRKEQEDDPGRPDDQGMAGEG